MIGYTKLFESLVTSTIWQKDLATRVVWVTMLALKNRDHVVEASVPGLAHVAGVKVEECRKALEDFSSPDPDSRSHEWEGRRIQEVEGGWLILNGQKYQDKMSREEIRAANARRMQIYRDKLRKLQKEMNQAPDSGVPTLAEQNYVKGEADPVPDMGLVKTVDHAIRDAISEEKDARAGQQIGSGDPGF